jgi:hypothetical protein
MLQQGLYNISGKNQAGQPMGSRENASFVTRLSLNFDCVIEKAIAFVVTIQISLH